MSDEAGLKLYFGIGLSESNELRAARSSLCSSLGLVPRSEAHVTIAYVGQVTEAELAQLGAELNPLLGDDLASFQLAGTGAAFEATAGSHELLYPTDLARASARACVAWWSIELTPTLSRLRAAASNLLAHWGRPLPANEPYRPHVTLGSRASAEIADKDFDIFTLEKQPTLGVFGAPDRVHSARAHFTATKLLPHSALCLRAW